MSQPLSILHGSPVAIVLLWLAAAVVALLLLVVLRPRRVLLASDANGRLRITRRALHSLVEACCEQVRGVASARARVTGPAGKFRTRIRLKVHPGARLDAIQGYLKQEVAEVFRQNLGLINEGPVEIEITGVVPEDKTL